VVGIAGLIWVIGGLFNAMAYYRLKQEFKEYKQSKK
jgi:hypothetical protein